MLDKHMLSLFSSWFGLDSTNGWDESSSDLIVLDMDWPFNLIIQLVVHSITQLINQIRYRLMFHLD